MKAQQSPAYAQKLKLINLQQMAKTVAYIQEHQYDTEEDLQNAYSEAQTQSADLRKALRSTEESLRKVNRQIHYTGQYLTNKPFISSFFNPQTRSSSGKSTRRRSPFMNQPGKF